MATREDLLPPFDRPSDATARIDGMALEERTGMSLEEIVERARQGDVLDFDLLRSGFFGDDIQIEDPSGDLADAALGDFLIRTREEAIDRRWGVDEATLLNFAFLYNHHYVEVDKARRAVVPIPAPKDVVRRKINKFAPWYRAQHTKLSQARPKWGVKAGRPQQLDKDAADFATQAGEWLTSDTYSHDNRSEAAMWMLMSGIAIVFSGVEFTRDPEFLVGPDGRPIPKPVFETQVLSPQEVWVDSRVSTLDDMRWVGRDRFVPVAEARGLFPEKSEKIDPEDAALSDRGHQIARRIQNLVPEEDPFNEHPQMLGDVSRVDEEAETVLSEFYGRKGITIQVEGLARLAARHEVTMEVIQQAPETSQSLLPDIVRFPEGIHAIFTPAGDVLRVTDNPYERIPFREMRFSKSPGFWPQAPASHLRQINQALDWAYSLIEEHLLKTGRSPLLEPEQARVHRRGFITAGMQRIRYRANRFNVKPEYMDPPPLPQNIVQFIGALDTIWDELAARHDVSQGELPSSEISGVAIGLLQEADQQQFGFSGAELEDAFIDVLRMQLNQMQRFFFRNDPRLLEIAGDARYQLKAFMQANLEDGLDLSVVQGSAIPQSPAALEAKAVQAWQLGVMVDDLGRPDYRRMQEILGFGTEDELFREEHIDKQNARSEEELIFQLTPPELVGIFEIMQQEGRIPDPLQIEPYDDHLVHERSHRMRLKEAKQDPRVHPFAVQLLELHWSLHLQSVMPILTQTEPEVAIPALGGVGAAQEGGGEREAEAES